MNISPENAPRVPRVPRVPVTESIAQGSLVQPVFNANFDRDGSIIIKHTGNSLILPFDKRIIYQNRHVVERDGFGVVENHDYIHAFTIDDTALSVTRDTGNPLQWAIPALPEPSYDNGVGNPELIKTQLRQSLANGMLYIPVLAVQTLVVRHGSIVEPLVTRFWAEINSPAAICGAPVGMRLLPSHPYTDYRLIMNIFQDREVAYSHVVDSNQDITIPGLSNSLITLIKTMELLETAL